MNILSDVARELLKMFASDSWLVVGILTVVSLTGLLIKSGAAPSLVAGAILFLGCLFVLIVSVVSYARRRRRH
jgi:hypothetical protein